MKSQLREQNETDHHRIPAINKNKRLNLSSAQPPNRPEAEPGVLYLSLATAFIASFPFYWQNR
jgi:hypothetical protein